MSTSTAETLAPLRDVHASSRLGPYLTDLYGRRSYVWHVAVNELRHRQITSVLGNLWHLLNPALTIGVYYLIFGPLLGIDRGVDNFLLFLTIGLFIFQFTQKATIDGAKSIVTNLGIIRAVRFPRSLLPTTSTVTEFLASAPNFVVLYFVAIVAGVPVSIRWLAMVPVVAIQLVFTLGAAMVAARMAHHFIDTIQILPFVFRLVLYSSGVIFSVDAYVESDSWVQWLFTLNPMYCYITLARWSVLGGDFPADLLLSGSVWAVAMLVAGFLWFRAAEERYARD
ncbi:MAG: ABC transporter permease [Ilumatobacter sp.]|nr:ABC transporter permease [Ilumatobacter sp.]